MPVLQIKHQSVYRIPHTYILAFGYFTAAMRNEVSKVYNLHDIIEWGKTRPWSTAYSDYKEFKSKCQEVQRYLNKWFKPNIINVQSENYSGTNDTTCP